MKKIFFIFFAAAILFVVAAPVQAQDYRAWWGNYWGGNAPGSYSHYNHHYSYYRGSSNDMYNYTYHYGDDKGHSVASIQRLPDKKGFLVVLEDGRVVTIDPSGKIVADNNKGRLAEKAVPWAAILGIIGILAH